MYKNSIIFNTFVLIAFLIHGTFQFKRNELIVKTSNGLLKGKLMKTHKDNVEYIAFFKIPYAKPPIGNLRFKPPEFTDNWKGIYDSTKEGDACLQYASKYEKNFQILGSEDCLFLRIYTPKLSGEDDILLPIIYYVHGGAYEVGIPSYDSYSPDTFLEKNVILALVQYRLGVYGFLSTEDLNCPGNNGIRDQRLGLKWLKRNAKAFGGDPEKIIIYGHSSGGSAIGILHDTPTTEGDFRGVIQQSGSEIESLMPQINARERAFRIGEKLGIATSDSKELIEKLKKIDSKVLFDIASHNEIEDVEDAKYVTYSPIIEPDHADAIISHKPLEQLEKGNFNRVPVIIGFTSLEAFLLLSDKYNATVRKIKTDLSYLVPYSLIPKDNATKLLLAEEIKKYYYRRDDFVYSTLRYMSDNVIVRPLLKKAHIISRYSPTYLYKISYRGYLGCPKCPNRRGVGHGEELQYIFKNSSQPRNISEGDAKIREQLMTMLTNFAKTLNPTPKEDYLLDNVIWPLYKKETNYKGLSIDTQLTVKEKINETDFLFWEKMFSYDTQHTGYF